MYYEINIAKNGIHYFATAERSITTPEKAVEVLVQLKKAFKAEDGYSFTLMKYEKIGESIDIQHVN